MSGIDAAGEREAFNAPLNTVWSSDLNGTDACVGSHELVDRHGQPYELETGSWNLPAENQG